MTDVLWPKPRTGPGELRSGCRGKALVSGTGSKFCWRGDRLPLQSWEQERPKAAFRRSDQIDSDETAARLAGLEERECLSDDTCDGFQAKQ